MQGRALVLGGGGIAGIAWEIGMLVGLRAAGVDVTDAETVVGTSAGSVVGSIVTADGVDLDAAYEAQVAPVAPAATAGSASARPSTRFDSEEMFMAMAAAVAGATSAQDARARIGAYALANVADPDADQRAVMARLLPSTEWPARRLLVAAVEAESGEPVAFDRFAGVDLVDAVTASCCVPGVWTPPAINGRRYVDGGVSSMVNADRAAGHARVLILAPMPGLGFQPEVRRLEAAGSTVCVVYGDAEAKAAFGTNPLDPATRSPSARAGYAQAGRVAADVRALWAAAGRPA